MFPSRVLSVLASFALAGRVLSHGLRHDKRSSPLEVELAVPASGDVSELVARITNVGTADLNLLKVGTLLDDKLPVQKLVVLNEAGDEIQAKAILPSIQYDALQSKHFQLLKASETIEIKIDGGVVHGFEESGTYSFAIEGLIPVAIAPSTTLSGPAVTVRSDPVSMYVGVRAASFVGKILDDRTNLNAASCSVNKTREAASTTALANCQDLATAAADDAADPTSDRFVEYFKTNSSETRKTVEDRLRAVAKECSTTDSGVSTYRCDDYYNLCDVDGPVNAYTLWDQDSIVMCPLFYDTLPPLPPGCHKQCQATTTIHETSHCDSVYSPHTNDWTYGYNDSTALDPAKALANADNYSLYANAVYLDC